VSEKWFPITSAEHLVRHLLKWDKAADKIEARLQAWNPVASREELAACQRLLMQRRRWEAGVQVALHEGRAPTEESIAAWAKVEPRTVQRWRHGA
jgi:hypothetical protein